MHTHTHTHAHAHTQPGLRVMYATAVCKKDQLTAQMKGSSISDRIGMPQELTALSPRAGVHLGTGNVFRDTKRHHNTDVSTEIQPGQQEVNLEMN